jgi:hypothetical protein
MERRGQARDRHGRVWTATVLTEAEAEDEDFRFWSEELTPVERVAAVEDCLLSALKAKGVGEIPRLRRVRRVLEPQWCQPQDEADVRTLRRVKRSRGDASTS